MGTYNGASARGLMLLLLLYVRHFEFLYVMGFEGTRPQRDIVIWLRFVLPLSLKLTMVGEGDLFWSANGHACLGFGTST